MWCCSWILLFLKKVHFTAWTSFELIDKTKKIYHYTYCSNGIGTTSPRTFILTIYYFLSQHSTHAWYGSINCTIDFLQLVKFKFEIVFSITGTCTAFCDSSVPLKRAGMAGFTVLTCWMSCWYHSESRIIWIHHRSCSKVTANSENRTEPSKSQSTDKASKKVKIFFTKNLYWHHHDEKRKEVTRRMCWCC